MPSLYPIRFVYSISNIAFSCPARLPPAFAFASCTVTVGRNASVTGQLQRIIRVRRFNLVRSGTRPPACHYSFGRSAIVICGSDVLLAGS